jgi:hypothetical protein
MVTTTHLKGVLYGEKGELRVISHERRLLLAKCKPEISIYEKSTQINVLGVIGHKEKVIHCAIALCPEPEIFHEMTTDFVRSITKVELYFDIQDSEGIYETIRIDSLETDDLNYDGDWKFEATLSPQLAAKLLGYLNYNDLP